MKLKTIMVLGLGVISTSVAFATNTTKDALALIAAEGQKQAVSTTVGSGNTNLLLIGGAAAFVIWYLNKN